MPVFQPGGLMGERRGPRWSVREASGRVAPGLQRGPARLPPSMLAWSLRSSAALGLLALAARPPASAAEATALAAAALVVTAASVRPAESARHSA